MSEHQPRSTRHLSLSWTRALSLLALFGLALWVSDLLVLEHIDLKLGDDQDSGVCGASSIFSCKAAAASVYGSLWGVPVAMLGEAYYLTAALAMLTAKLSAPRLTLLPVTSWGGVLLSALTGAASLSVLYSLFLGAVSALSLGLFCPLCLTLYALNIASGALLWRSLQVSEGAPSRLRGWVDVWRTMWRKPAPWLLTLLMGASVIAAQGAYATRYNHKARQLKRAARVPVQREVKAEGPVRGESSAAVLVEFSDFQCPFCARFTYQLKQAFEQLKAEEGGAHAFQYVFRHYPLSKSCNPYAPEMHPRACHAAAAAICAEEQGKFWEMHDLLFSHQHELEDEHLGAYAKQIGLNMSAFVDCLPSDRVRARISADIKAGRKAKVRGTPAFFINGWSFSGAIGVNKLKREIKRYAYGVLEDASPAPQPTPQIKKTPTEAGAD